MITAVMAVFELFSADAFVGADMCLPETNVPTPSEWGKGAL